MNNTMVGVDLAKEVIQVCIYTNQIVHSNKELTHNEFLLWLFKTKPTTLIFEACGTSNYWKQKAIEAGHNAQLISAKLVATVRQNQQIKGVRLDCNKIICYTFNTISVISVYWSYHGKTTPFYHSRTTTTCDSTRK